MERRESKEPLAFVVNVCGECGVETRDRSF